MRTTITLDPDVAALIDREMKARRVRFKDAVNDALRRQLGGGTAPTLSLPSRDLGAAAVDLTTANRLAAELEDDELARKLTQGR